ncbi:hypothetical protein [Tenacibaculum maritimum]|uniref:hypothetical protein n=1 Tax=Tenacibaculum maritimum TaxID=107401 RepID=UPI0003FBF0E9|nr:hypothetical protein [Tenacibaculum maritimum]
MNNVENYEQILAEIYNVKPSLKNKNLTNNCIGALNGNHFSVFKNNFIKRLKRINHYYKNDPQTLKEIIDTCKVIGKKEGYKWSGAYSELVALDYWLNFKDSCKVQFIEKKPTKLFPYSVAYQIGKKTIDFDLKIDLFPKTLFLDVKSFILIHDELSNMIMDRVKKLTKNVDYLIGLNNTYDIDYNRIRSDLQNELINSKNLVNELVNSVKNKKKSHSYKLASGRLIEFRMSYPKSKSNLITLQTISQFDPYLMAKNYSNKILDYYVKLIMDKSSLILWVLNPWFFKEPTPFFSKRNDEFIKAFTRSLSRRVFMDLSTDHRRMSELYPKSFNKKNDMYVHEVSKLINGIMFIFDYSVNEGSDNIYDSYLFLNPNAKNIVLKESDFSLINTLNTNNHIHIDDFRNDYY